MRRMLLVSVLLVLFAPFIASADAIRTDAQPLDTAFLLSPDTHSNLSGFASDITVDPNNICFDATPDNQFSGGESVALNVFWEDTKQEDIQTYNVTWGVQRPRGGILVLLQDDCNFNLTGIGPGTPVNFCCVLSVEGIPSLNLTTQWGARVIRGDTLQGPLQTVTLVP